MNGTRTALLSIGLFGVSYSPEWVGGPESPVVEQRELCNYDEWGVYNLEATFADTYYANAPGRTYQSKTAGTFELSYPPFEKYPATVDLLSVTKSGAHAYVAKGQLMLKGRPWKRDQRIALFAHISGKPWRKVQENRANRMGKVGFTVKPSRRTWYQMRRVQTDREMRNSPSRTFVLTRR